MTKCCQIKCELPATKLVYWPGDLPKPMCDIDALKASNIAGAMGMYIHIEVLKEDKN